MSGVEIRVDVSDLLRKAKRVRSMQHEVPRAIREGLQQGGDKVRTDVRRALRQQMGTKTARAINERTRSFVEPAPGGARYVIVGFGKGLPIREFRTALRKGDGGGVTASPWSAARQFARSFSLGGANPDRFRARTTDKRFPVRRLYGPSVPKEMLKGSVPRVFLLSARAQVVPPVLRRLARALGAR